MGSRRSVIIVGGLLAILLGVMAFLFFGPMGSEEWEIRSLWKGGEVGTILPADQFTGKAREAYAAAATIPDVLDYLYCYCHCSKHLSHKSLKTCYVTNHAAVCDLCMDEALVAAELRRQKVRIKAIREEIDRRFYKPYTPSPHGNFMLPQGEPRSR